MNASRLAADDPTWPGRGGLQHGFTGIHLWRVVAIAVDEDDEPRLPGLGVVAASAIGAAAQGDIGAMLFGFLSGQVDAMHTGD